MRLRALVAVVAVVAISLVGLLASPAQAATSQGCSGSLSSVDDRGAPLDKVTIPGPNGTNADPFQLYWAGLVNWTGQTNQAVANGTWQVTVQHPSWLFALGQLVTGHRHGLTGTFDSGQGATSFYNWFTPSSVEPVTLPGQFEIGFTVTGSRGVVCTGTISVRVLDSPGHNPLWWLALILLIAGLAMLFIFGVWKITRPVHVRKRRVLANTLAGLFIGIALSLMVTLSGSVGWSTTTPDLIVVLGVVVGLGAGLVPVRTLRQPAEEDPAFAYTSPRS